MLDILQTDRVEMPTPLDPKKPGLLINVHLGSHPISEAEMDQHGKSLLKKEKLRRYAGASVVYWLQSGDGKERLRIVEA